MANKKRGGIWILGNNFKDLYENKLNNDYCRR